jgi:hypothetical protein
MGRAPDIDFRLQDLQDRDRRVTAETVRRDYGFGPAWARERYRVYTAWVPLDEIPDPVLAEESHAEETHIFCLERAANEMVDCLERAGDDGEALKRCHENHERDVEACARVLEEERESYPWEDMRPNATFPPAKLLLDADGNVLILDGNHRLHFWREAGFTHAGAWVLQEPLRPGAMMERRKPEDVRRQAVLEYGTTDDPTTVGFILADGTWLDFGEGAGMGRTLDHRNIAFLLEDHERPPETGWGPATEAMNRWMDLAQAVRVMYNPRRGGESYAMLDLPEESTALRAVLGPTGRRSIAKFLRGVGEVSVALPGGQRVEIEPYHPGELMAVLDQALEEAAKEGGKR